MSKYTVNHVPDDFDLAYTLFGEMVDIDLDKAMAYQEALAKKFVVVPDDMDHALQLLLNECGSSGFTDLDQLYFAATLRKHGSKPGFAEAYRKARDECNFFPAGMEFPGAEERLIGLLANIENYDCALSKTLSYEILEKDPELKAKWGKVYKSLVSDHSF